MEHLLLYQRTQGYRNVRKSFLVYSLLEPITGTFSHRNMQMIPIKFTATSITQVVSNIAATGVTQKALNRWLHSATGLRTASLLGRGPQTSVYTVQYVVPPR